ncbi:MAG: FUSC family protein [Candidatus Acidiferrales bacterium]
MRWLRWPVVVHSVRTGAATLASLLVARVFRLPEAYCAPITTIVITHSSLGAAFEVSWERFLGTLLGAALGAIVAMRYMKIRAV